MAARGPTGPALTRKRTNLATDREIPITQSALLVVDVQDSFKVAPRWERRSSLTFEAHVDRLIGAYRDAGLPVVFILHTDADEHFQPGSPWVKLMDFISPRADEPVLVKSTRNSFTSTDLRQILDSRGVKRLAIAGIQTEQCCETTARLAADLGYDVDFVIDATLTFPIADAETGDELSTAEILRHTQFVLRGRFAHITPVERLVAELRTAVTKSGVCGA
jgi:nicotinamidase-related amidase